MLTVYEAIVPGWIQLLTGLQGVLTKAEAHCEQTGAAQEDIAALKLAPDMFDFAFQVAQTRVHSVGAIAAARTGTFSPNRTPGPRDFAGMQAMIDAALADLAAIDPVDMEALSTRPMQFSNQDVTIKFTTVKDFFLGFSQPSFYFHVTTAYALLRAEGVEIGKRDYMGPLRVAK